MPFVESFDEFKERMDCECIGGNWEIGPRHMRTGWLFSNGGFSDGDVHFDPPTDEMGLATMQRQYLTHQEKEWEQAFIRLKTQAFEAAKWSGRNVPTISEDHIAQLEEIQSKVFELREQIEPLDEILSERPEVIALEKREREDQANYAKRQRLVRKVNQIEI